MNTIVTVIDNTKLLKPQLAEDNGQLRDWSSSPSIIGSTNKHTNNREDTGSGSGSGTGSGAGSETGSEVDKEDDWTQDLLADGDTRKQLAFYTKQQSDKILMVHTLDEEEKFKQQDQEIKDLLARGKKTFDRHIEEFDKHVKDFEDYVVKHKKDMDRRDEAFEVHEKDFNDFLVKNKKELERNAEIFEAHKKDFEDFIVKHNKELERKDEEFNTHKKEFEDYIVKHEKELERKDEAFESHKKDFEDYVAKHEKELERKDEEFNTHKKEFEEFIVKNEEELDRRAEAFITHKKEFDDYLVNSKRKFDEHATEVKNNFDEHLVQAQKKFTEIEERIEKGGIGGGVPKELIGETGYNKQVILLMKDPEDTDLPTVGVMGGEILEDGENVQSHYQFSLSATGVRFLKGASSFSKKAEIVLVSYKFERYFGLRLPSAEAAEVWFSGWKRIPEALLPPDYSTYTDGDLSDFVVLSNESDTGTQTISVDLSNSAIESVKWNFTSKPSGWADSTDNSKANFGKGLTLLATCSTSIDPNHTFNNDVGYLQMQHSTVGTGGFKIKLSAPGTLTVAFTATNQTDQTSQRTVYLKDSRMSGIYAYVSSTNLYDTKVLTYTKSDYTDETFIICHDGGAIRYRYVQFASAGNVANKVLDTINKLPETGEDGAPHKMALKDITITRAMLLNIATLLRQNSKVQVDLDLSGCTMETRYVSWSADTNTTTDGSQDGTRLDSLFSQCVSLREFSYPQGVTTSGNQTFKGCTSLRKVHFPQSLTSISSTSDQWQANGNYLFYGTRIRKLFIPRNVTNLGSYFAAGCNIQFLYFEQGSRMNMTQSVGQRWQTWYAVRNTIKIYCPGNLLYSGNWNYNATFNTGINAGSTLAEKYIHSGETLGKYTYIWSGLEADIDFES